jgi:sirohydrochlorin ferrochelatase
MKSPREDPAGGTAVLLVAHGSRRQDANRDLEALAEQLRARAVCDWVEIAYLEAASPTIPDGCRTCVQRGARRVVMLPWFLSAGRHVVEDLERIRDEQAAAFPGVEFRLCPPLGLHPLMIEIVLDRLAEGAR